MRRFLIPLFFFILAFFAWKPLLSPGFFTMHDSQQVVRLAQLDKSLKAGQFPVRWVEDLGYGYGYPLFNFYPPLTYYVGEGIHLLGFSFVDATKGIWLLALVFSAVSMYFLAKEFFGEIGAVISGIFYLYAPYHAVDAYVRGALAELFSFVWLPLILLAVYRKRPVWAGIFLGLLMITHNLIFLPFMGFFAIWALFYDRKSLIISPVIAFGLTAFFWLPSLTEKQFTLVDQLLIKNLASYKIHFLCPAQLWYSQWGFGGSTAGCVDGMSFMVGKIYFLVMFIGLVIGIYKKSLPAILALILVVFSAFMTTSYSQIFWDKISVLWYLQFPWRFLEFIVLFAAFTAGAVGLLSKKIAIPLAILLIAAVIFIDKKYFVPQRFLPNATDKTLLSDYMVKWYVSDSSFEYLPSGFATKVGPLGTVIADIDESKIGKYGFEPGKFEFTSYGPTIVQVQQTNFPGWKVWIDNNSVKIGDNNPYKLITVDIPEGQHVVKGEFTNTPVRVLGNAISVLSISILAVYFVKLKKDAKKN